MYRRWKLVTNISSLYSEDRLQRLRQDNSDTFSTIEPFLEKLRNRAPSATENHRNGHTVQFVVGHARWVFSVSQMYAADSKKLATLIPKRKNLKHNQKPIFLDEQPEQFAVFMHWLKHRELPQAILLPDGQDTKSDVQSQRFMPLLAMAKRLGAKKFGNELMAKLWEDIGEEW